MHGPIDAGIVASWAVPALLVGLVLGVIGVRLSRAAREETDTTFGFALIALMIAGAVLFVDYYLLSRRVFSDEEIRGGIGLVMASSCCASPGIGAFLAGALWAIVRAYRRRSQKPPDAPVEF